jgi:hypothetical protein
MRVREACAASASGRWRSAAVAGERYEASAGALMRDAADFQKLVFGALGW